MQTADALQQDVHRAQVGDQEIGVDIETLFESLSTDDDQSAAWPLLAQAFFDRGVEQRPVLAAETAVM
jgi:hypothetical protein